MALFLCGLSASAQRRLVVVDVETLEPVDGANVVCNSLSAQTDTLGFITVPDSCRSLLFSHVNYESRLINLTEVRDTVFLISKLLNVKEVVVFGQAPYDDKYKELGKQMIPSKTDLQLSGAKPDGGLNLLGLLSYLIPKKWKKSAKERRKEQMKQVLEEY
ncbi:MAG: hypothetical protein J6Z14_12185 [Prevotella sp.]|nr:hypothetical protein [Prevotella sp.]